MKCKRHNTDQKEIRTIQPNGMVILKYLYPLSSRNLKLHQPIEGKLYLQQTDLLQLVLTTLIKVSHDFFHSILNHRSNDFTLNISIYNCLILRRFDFNTFQRGLRFNKRVANNSWTRSLRKCNLRNKILTQGLTKRETDQREAMRQADKQNKSKTLDR